MELLQKGRFYIAITQYADRSIPKTAEFTWDGTGAKCGQKGWFTQDKTKAARLAEYASPALRADLLATTARQEAILEGSMATSTDRVIITKDGKKFFPYQGGGIASTLDRFDQGNGVLLADDMGLGKTPQAIGVIDNKPEIKRVLIVCPASIKRNWERELKRWLVKDLSIGVQIGGNFPATDIVITNFDMLKEHRYSIRAVQWDLLIVDEAHYLKNHKTGRAAEVMGKDKAGELIAPIPCKFKLFLTGSPAPNRPTELYGLVNFLAPGQFGSYRKFESKYGGGQNLDELQLLLRETVMIRRLKKDVLSELPAKIRQIVELPASPDAMAAVRAELATFERLQELQRLIKARKVSGANPDEPEYKAAVAELREAEKVVFAEMSKRRHETAIKKLPIAIEFIDEAVEQSKKVIVFAHHQDMVKGLAKHFGTRCVVIDGSTPPEKRQGIVDRFQNDPAVEVIIGSAAMREGVTLTASSHVILVELDWVPGNVSQEEDRAHRIGQLSSVLVQHLVLEGSLDARMAVRIVEKQAEIDAALNTQANAGSLGEVKAEIEAGRKERADALEAAKARAEDERVKIAAQRCGREIVVAPGVTEAVVQGILTLAGCDPDHASQQNETGFNKLDTKFGNSLAEQISKGRTLSPKQIAAAAALLRKYHRQLGADIIGRLECAA